MSHKCFICSRFLVFVKTEGRITIIAQSQLGACLRHPLNLISFLDGTSGSHCQPVLNRLDTWKIKKKHGYLKNHHNSSKAKIVFVYNNDNSVSIADNFNALSSDMESWTLWSNVRPSNWLRLKKCYSIIQLMKLKVYWLLEEEWTLPLVEVTSFWTVWRLS